MPLIGGVKIIRSRDVFPAPMPHSVREAKPENNHGWHKRTPRREALRPHEIRISQAQYRLLPK